MDSTDSTPVSKNSTWNLQPKIIPVDSKWMCVEQLSTAFLPQQRLYDNTMPVYIVDSRLT